MATDDVIIQCSPTREEEEEKGEEETETAKEVEAEKREEELVEATEGEGEGRGGKLLRLRRKWSLSPKTPYERPLLRRHGVVQLTNPNVNSFLSLDANDGSLSWLSRFAAGAGKLLSSVFRRNEASPSSSAASEYSSEGEEEGDSAEKLPAVESERTADGCKESEQSLALGIRRSAKLSAIEEVLSDKTFTWDEFIYLTELLQSRIVDKSLIREPGFIEKMDLYSRSYPRHTAVEEARRWSEERKKALEESTNSRLHTSLCSNLPNVNLSSDILENSTSSPVDIAKAYMGVRPAWASSTSPQVLKFDLSGNHENLNQAQPSYLSNGIQSSATASSNTFSVLQNRVHIDTSQYGLQMLKRRSSEIDDNWASVGTSGRIRQKSCDIDVEVPVSLEARDDEMKFSQPSGSCQEPDKIDGDLDKKLPIPNENTGSPENVAIVECSKQSVTPLDLRATVELDNNIENAINGNDKRKTLAATESTGLEDITTSVAAVVSVFGSLKESTQTEGVTKGASFTDVNNSGPVPDENHSVSKMTNLVSSNEVSHNFSIRQLINKAEATAGKTSNGVAEASAGPDEGTIENAELSTPVTSGRRLLTKRVVSKSRFASNSVSKAESSTRRKPSHAPKEAKSKAKKNNESLEKSSDAAEAGGAVRRIRRVRRERTQNNK